MRGVKDACRKCTADERLTLRSRPRASRIAKTSSIMNELSTDLVTYRRDGPIAFLGLNRPQKLNAFSDELVVALVAALRRFDSEDEARVAVLSGHGRAFSSGADVQQRQMRSREELLALGGPEGWGARGADVFTRSVNWKPVVAAAHGYAIGMGLGIMLSADMVVAESGTQFQVTETPRGLSPVRYAFLMRLRGSPGFAMEMGLTGRYFTAEEAHADGLVDRVAPSGEHVRMAVDLALQIAANPPLSVRALVRARRAEMEEAERRAALLTEPMQLHLTADFAESARAFVEKRKPRAFLGN